MKRVFLILLLCGMLLLTGCARKSVAAEVSLAGYIPDSIEKIRLTNCHNGQFTYITETGAIVQISEFLRTVTGTGAESGKGYYEGSYSIDFYQEKEIVFSVAFGDSDCFYMGAYGDGYPIRYLLKDITISGKIIPFFSQFDSSVSQQHG